MNALFGILLLVTLFVVFGLVARERRGGGCACGAIERKTCGACSFDPDSREGHDDRP